MNDRRREDRCDPLPPDDGPSPWGFLGRAARSRGFAAAGVAPAAGVPSPASAAYRAWLAAGRHAGMAFAGRGLGQRFDPRREEIVGGATAVVSAALPYGEGAARSGIWRHVAAHARGRDYHATVRERLSLLAADVVARFPGARCRVFVDTAPILERTWAALAGVGSIGANGALFVPGVGPRVVLGEIVCAGTPAPSPAGAADPDPCTGCGACLAACPTGALAAPGVVDCRLCLSFHTIENTRSPIPEAVARHAALVFGCDACVSACPRAARPEPACGLEPPPVACPDGIGLGEIPAMDGPALSRLIAGTCLERTGAAVIGRNARIVLAARRAVS